MPNYSKNIVILVRYPFSDLSNAKVRPAVIVNAPQRSPLHHTQNPIAYFLKSNSDHLNLQSFNLILEGLLGSNLHKFIGYREMWFNSFCSL